MKVGIIGAGSMGQKHIQLIQNMQSADLVGVVDPVFGSGNSTGSEERTYQTFEVLEDLLAKTTPDVIHIVSPPVTHADLARQVINAGCHVYVEKPFVLGVETAEELIALAESKGVLICAGHQLLWHPAIKMLWEKLKGIGDYVHVDSLFYFQPARRELSGAMQDIGDQLVDVLPHPTYLLLAALDMSGNSEALVQLDALSVRPNGDIRLAVSKGPCTGFMNVSLVARPVDNYLRVCGTRGTFEADLVLGSVKGQLAPRKSAVSVLLRPFSTSFQTMWRTTRSLFSAAFGKNRSYPGLSDIVESFYTSIRDNGSSPVPPGSIVDTVRLCEQIQEALREERKNSELKAKKKYDEACKQAKPVDAQEPTVAVTGAGGFLGREVVARLSDGGRAVRALVRTPVLYERRVPGVDYVQVDLAGDGLEQHLSGVGTVVHLAAETAGGKDLHERNTIDATKRLLQACDSEGVREFLNISSIAVLRPGNGEALNDGSPVDQSSESRGPYVWAKATAEEMAEKMCEDSGISLRTLRPGPLVDMSDLEPPGRLGRLLG